MKKMPDKYYPLLKINGQDVGMNVSLYQGRRYWNFYCHPDLKLDETNIDRIFPYLCELDGFMHSIDRAFHEYQKVVYCGEGTLLMSCMWLSGEFLTRDHMMYIIEQAALPHWLKAGKVIEDWLGDRPWDLRTLRDMFDELYDSRKERQCHRRYLAWTEKRSLARQYVN